MRDCHPFDPKMFKIHFATDDSVAQVLPVLSLIEMHYSRGGEDQEYDYAEHNEKELPECGQRACSIRSNCGVKSDIVWGIVVLSD